MKNLFLSVIAISFAVVACKKNGAEKTVSADTVNVQSTPYDTSQSSKDTLTSHDSINTKTHTGGRKTSNNNTGNGTGNVNAAMSDSLQPRQK
ncbi:hypothetical protein [Chryseobacterium phocaeense]|uniref:hypothetical protein n=1 Tax=Chryseobacterium phocaeense TaxID=1816690 RepID=UPI0009B9A2E5|nr:hypothetical protein [Chryseobacterium phocaeense]